MILRLLTSAGPRPASASYGDDSATADGACPHCGATPFRVAGCGVRPSADDRAYEADAKCVSCFAAVGTLRAEAETIFGVREDEDVCARARVYDGRKPARLA